MPKDSPGKGIGEDEFFAAESTRASEEVERVTSGIELEREASKTFGCHDQNKHQISLNA